MYSLLYDFNNKYVNNIWKVCEFSIESLQFISILMSSVWSIQDYLPQLLVLLSGIGYCIQGLGLKLLSTSFVTVIIFIFFKGLLQFIIMLIVTIVYTRGFTCQLSIFKLNKPLLSILIVRSILGFASACLSFKACQLLPLGEAAALFLTSPMFATIGAVLFLGEAIGRKEYCTMFLGFLGISLIIIPQIMKSHTKINSQEIQGLHFAVLATLTSAGSYLTLRMMGTKVQASWILIAFSSAIGQIILGSIIFMILYQFIDKNSDQYKVVKQIPNCTPLSLEMIDNGEMCVEDLIMSTIITQKYIHPITSTTTIRDILIITSTILLGTCSQIAHSYGVQYLKASQTTIMKSADIVFNFTAQALGTHDSIAVTSISGSCLIIISIFLAFTNVEHDFIPRYLTNTPKPLNYQLQSRLCNEQTRLLRANEIAYTVIKK